jgi:glutamine synthetase
MMAETLKQFKKDVDALIEKGEKKEIAIMHVLRNYIAESKKIRFEGDNYSDEWAAEAKKRGLNNFKTTPEALAALVTPQAKKLFIENGIYSEVELEARHEIMLEDYVKKVQIEARILGNIATNHILPAAVKYQNLLIENVKNLKEIGVDAGGYKAQLNMINVIGGHMQAMSENVEAMIAARKVANNEPSMHKRAEMYCNNIKSLFDNIRYAADKLELLVDNSNWPLPTYHEMLYLG